MKMIATVYTPETAWPAFGHLWTLAVEQQFYLIFPFLMLVPRRSTRSFILLALIVLAPAIRGFVGAWATWLGWDSGRAAFAIYAFGPAHFDAFAIGTLIALFRSEIAKARRLTYIVFAIATVVTCVHVTAVVCLPATLWRCPALLHYHPDAGRRAALSAVWLGGGNGMAVPAPRRRESSRPEASLRSARQASQGDRRSHVATAEARKGRRNHENRAPYRPRPRRRRGDLP